MQIYLIHTCNRQDFVCVMILKHILLKLYPMACNLGICFIIDYNTFSHTIMNNLEKTDPSEIERTYTQWPLGSYQISLQKIDKKYGLKQCSFLAN